MALKPNIPSSEHLDDVDIAILRELQSDARLTIRQLSARLHRSPSPIFERVRRLEREGYIHSYVTVLDAERLGRGFQVFCQVKMKELNTTVAERFVAAVEKFDEVTECYNISGNHDFLLKVCASSMSDYRKFTLEKLGTIEGVVSIETTFVMCQHKRVLGLPI